MPYALASPRERTFAVALAVWLGVMLALGFLPSVNAFAEALTSDAYLKRSFFPLLSLLFLLSLPKPKTKAPKKIPATDALLTMPVPFLIAAAFGYFHSAPSLFDAGDWASAYWLLVCIPLGEEFLFRGWSYTVGERLWPGKMFTATNPFPVAVWVSTISFSLWHLQNYPKEPIAFVVFQMSYSLVTGMWFGYLRWRSGKLYYPILAHFLLNLGANIL